VPDAARDAIDATRDALRPFWPSAFT
jgi:hypothetical protein